MEPRVKVASTPTWWMSPIDVANEWERVLTQRGEDIPIPAIKLAAKAIERASLILTNSGLEARPVPRNKRDWSGMTRTPASVIEKEMRDLLERHGWKLHIAPSRQPTPLDLARDGVMGDAVVLVRADARQRAEVFAEAGLDIPWSEHDALAEMLCGEVYQLISDKIGRRPQPPIVDDFAAALFTRSVMGLPFTPWVIELLRLRAGS